MGSGPMSLRTARPLAKDLIMKATALVLLSGLGLVLASPAAQSPKHQTLTGTLTIKTKGATTAVLGKLPDKAEGEFMFCIDQERSAPQAIEFSGPGRVVFQPMPKPPMPEGITITGPEMVAPALAVLAEDGKAWLFIEKGQKTSFLAGDPLLGKATRVNIQTLRRTDWAAARGPRRGISLEGCLAPGG
jgi:hypothetical protein